MPAASACPPSPGDFRPCQMGTLLTLGQIGTLGSAMPKTWSRLAHCHSGCLPAQPTALLLTVGTHRLPALSGPPARAPPLLLTVAALVIPASDKAEITAAASKAGRFFCLRQHFPAKTPSGQPISGPKRGRKPGPFLETSSLFPPPAALRLFPHNTVENFVHNVENFPLCHPVEKL